MRATNPLRLRKKKEVPDWDEVKHVKVEATDDGWLVRCAVCDKNLAVGPPRPPADYFKLVDRFFKMHRNCASIAEHEANK